jgi:hypothetical protein
MPIHGKENEQQKTPWPADKVSSLRIMPWRTHPVQWQFIHSQSILDML